MSLTTEPSLHQGEEVQPIKWIFDTSRKPKPGKCKKLRAHRRRWFAGTLSERQVLYDAYGYDRQRYFLSYQPDEEDFTFFQERGMEAFVRMERRLQWWMRLKSYHQGGAQALKSFGAALASDKAIEEPNLMFVSLDFEGLITNRGISEIGIANIASREILSPESNGSIACFNFALKNHKNRRFLFGDTTRLSPEILQRNFINFFNDLIRENSSREIMLVSDGIHNEIRIMDDLGISLEALPITGLIDTCCLANDVLEFTGSLGHLLTALRVPARMDLLHCAGNDAHYTLQALLALLQNQYQDTSGRLEKLARQASPSHVKEEADNDWADNLQSDPCLQD